VSVVRTFAILTYAMLAGAGAARADETANAGDTDTLASARAPAVPATWFELHGYARMPLGLEATPRQPFLIDDDYYLSGFAYTRLYEPDWSEVFWSAHKGDIQVELGIFASLYSDYAKPELNHQLGIAQASVSAHRFLGQDPLSVKLGVFWDRFGHIEPYDTYLFGRTHQGGVKLRWDFAGGAHVQVGGGAHREQLQQNQGLTPIAHLTGRVPVGRLEVGGYLLRAWTRDQRQLSPIEDGDLWVLGADVRAALPRDLGPATLMVAYYDATRVLFLAPALELLHSTGGRGLTENFLGLASSNNGTGSLLSAAVDAPLHLARAFDLRVFGMTTWVRSDQVDERDASVNKDRRLYLKWGAEPSFALSPRLRAAFRYDRIILDVYDAENSFRAYSPKLIFPLSTWGELFVMLTHYRYGDKISLRPGQVPLETEPDTTVFKIQAQARW
jgi:hypothetical protein